MSAKDEHGLNPREKKFADSFLGGMPAGRAYEGAGYKSKGSVADVCASKLLRIAKVSAYLKARRKAFSEADRWEKWQMLDFHQAVLETPVGELNETSALVQEVTTDEIGEAVIRKKIKMVGKLDSAKEFAKLMGWYAPEVVKHEATEELEELIRLTRAGQ